MVVTTRKLAISALLITADVILTRLIAFKKNGSVVSSRIEPHGDGFYVISTIRNSRFDLMELKLYLDNKEEAKIMKAGFDERAEKIYSGILALYSGDMRYFD